MNTEYIINKGFQLDAEKISNVYANYERQEKHANGVFHKEIEHSHFSQRGNDRVLKFQGKLLFSDFVVE